MTNSRLKDYLDLSVLLEREVLDPATLAAAIAATFTRRGTALPTELPIGLSDEFANERTHCLRCHSPASLPRCAPYCSQRLGRRRQQT